MAPFFLLICGCFWLSVVVLLFVLRNQTARHIAGALIPLAGILLFLLLGDRLEPWQRLLLGSVGLLYLLKAMLLLQHPWSVMRSFSHVGIMLFMTLWPGMDPRPLRRRRHVQAPAGAYFTSGFLWGCVGLAAGLATILLLPAFSAEVAGWLGLLSLLLLIHFGYAGMLTAAMWLGGWNVGPLFRSPLASRSLYDFWTNRWNLAFVEMNIHAFQRPLRSLVGKRAAVAGLFVTSGLLHEIGISYPAGAGWGMPLAYFGIQGVLLLLEAHVLRIEQRWPAWAGRVWTWLAIVLPLPLLFHTPFRETLVFPLLTWLHRTLTARSISWYFDWALYLAAAGHLLVLIASAQVPARLGWKEDLAKLTPFNRKIMWTYGAFIVLCILSFGLLTSAFHDELLRGDPVALGLSAFIMAFWGMRVGVDLFYFRHADWPKGHMFEVGHVLLTALFVSLTTVYATLLFWHLSLRGA